jgi:outer membrane protein assembly factor BamB
MQRARLVPLLALVAGTTALALLKIRSPRVPATLPGRLPETQSAWVDIDAGGGGDAELTHAPLGRGPAPRRAADGSVSTLHGDPQHTDRIAAHGPRHPEIVWSVSVGGAVEAQPIASLDGRFLYIATLGGDLRALDRPTGHALWTVPLGGRSYATPTVGPDGTIYAGSDAQRLFAVDPVGKIRWKLELQGEADTGILLVGGGDLVVAAGSHVYRVHPDGTVVWRFDAGRKIFTSPARTNKDGIVFGAQDHNAYAVGPDGKLVYKVDLAADVDGSPVVDEHGTAFFGTDGGAIAAIDPRGVIKWIRPLPGYVRGTLSLARNGDILGGMYGPTPGVVRLNPDGYPVGRFSIDGTGAREFGVHGAPLEDDSGALFFGAEDDRVYAIGPDGAVMWTVDRGDDVDAPLTLLAPSDLVVASDDGTVALYREAQ